MGETKSGSFLTIGWQVTPNLDPRYWLNTGAKAGLQQEGDLVRIPGDSLSTHAAIIAQSGSGKSFLLGRLIEEILIETRSRCLVIDPNSDFRKVHQVVGPELWKTAEYDTSKRRGKLPHESTREEFLARWSKIPARIRTGNSQVTANSQPLKLRWSSLPMEFFAEELGPMLRGDLYHIHAFVQALEPLIYLRGLKEDKELDLIDEAERLFHSGRVRAEYEFRADLEREFDARELTRFLHHEKVMVRDGKIFVLGYPFLRLASLSLGRLPNAKTITNRIRGLLKAPKYVSEIVERFYFGKAREYQADGILESAPQPEKRSSGKHSVTLRRLEVLDLPSLPEGTRLLAVNKMLGDEWARARDSWDDALEKPAQKDERVPTFIVVDEAHNLISEQPRTKAEAALREQFRTIVAEGRKYGLFLVLVSQRPDKLDPLVLSECENKIIMKLGSVSVLAITRKLLGLEDTPSRMLEKCLEFEMGRGILMGRWAQQGPQLFYCAARRTVEGGRDLRSQYWASAPDFSATDMPRALVRHGRRKGARSVSLRNKKRRGRS